MAPGVVTVLRDAVTVLNFVASEGELPDVSDVCDALNEAVDRLSRAASGSWLGYQSRVYYRGYAPAPASAFFSQKWGLKHGEGPGESGEPWSTGAWVEHTHEEVLRALLRTAGNPDLAPIRAYRRQATEAFGEAKAAALGIIRAELEGRRDAVLAAAVIVIAAVEPISEAELIQREQPEFEDSDDAEAVREGIVAPVHVEVRALTSSVRDAGIRCQWLADRIESVAAHLEEHGSVVESRESNNRVFVGHLDSAAWRSLNGYLVDVLGLMPPWFDHVPPEGFGAAERLRRMVDGVAAAFLVVTLEDEHRWEDRLLRENVLHEIGLFQGRLGVNRAFILLEEGCEGFGSVSGVAQLVFPRGRIEAAFADVRRILERAEIL